MAVWGSTHVEEDAIWLFNAQPHNKGYVLYLQVPHCLPMKLPFVVVTSAARVKRLFGCSIAVPCFMGTQ